MACCSNNKKPYNCEYSETKFRKGIVHPRKSGFCNPFLILSFLFHLFCTSIFAQLQISVTVKTIYSLPVRGASISIKGGQGIAFTNEEGQFLITARLNDVLVFSSVGYLPKQVKVVSDNSLYLYLSRTAIDLEEILVTGYTTQRI